MKNDYYAKRTLLIILMSFFIGTMCTAQTVQPTFQTPINMQYSIAEMNWSEQEYKDYVLNKNKPANVAITKAILSLHNINECNEIAIPIPDKPSVRTMPIIPYNIIKEKDYENTIK